MKVKSLSVFFPAYNEEKNIASSVEKALRVLKDLGIKNYEVIVIDDGSSDGTDRVADDLAKKYSCVRVIHHPKNLGYGEALKSGFYQAKYDTIVYTDADGQFDFSEVGKFIDQLDGADVVVGYRLKRRDPLFRLLFAKGWAWSLWVFFGLGLQDVDCGFKMVKRKVLEKIPRLESTRGGMINAELAIKTKKFGFRITQVGVNHYPRLAGRPTGANLKVIVRSYVDLLQLWWKLLSKIEFLTVIGILGLAAWLRFFGLSEYMTFLGDEGRDALIIKKILTEGDLPFIGPPTSVGNIYLGPLYYYMMALPMAVFWLSPVAAAGMVAFLGVAAVFLVYYLGKKWFDHWSGIMAALLYAISPVNIIHSRSSWNPNPTPFFALLAIVFFHWAHKSRDFRWLILVGVSLSAALQMHYLALILLPITGILWLYELISSERGSLRYFWIGSLGAILAFLLLLSPWFLFELKYNFLNTRAIVEIFTGKESQVDLGLAHSFSRVGSIFTFSLISRYMVGSSQIMTGVVTGLVLWLIFTWWRWKNKISSWPVLVLSVWLMGGVLGLALYKREIFDHYLGFFNPAPFIILGSMWHISCYLSVKFHQQAVKVVTILLIGWLVVLNWQKSPLQFSPNRQLQRTQEVAKFIIEESKNQPFNFALIADRNYDAAYQFYLNVYGHKPKQVPFEITDQLFVVCEDPICRPINHPKQEISHFGWAKIEKQFEVEGVKVYKLIPNPSGKPG